MGLHAAAFAGLWWRGTVALGTRGNLIGAPTTKAVQTAAQLNAKIATLPALQSLKCPSTHGSIC